MKTNTKVEKKSSKDSLEKMMEEHASLHLVIADLTIKNHIAFLNMCESPARCPRAGKVNKLSAQLCDVTKKANSLGWKIAGLMRTEANTIKSSKKKV